MHQLSEPVKGTGTINVEKCMEMIESNDVTFITTQTGTGKSTVIPHAIAKANPSAIILATEPRRISAIQLAHRVASLLGTEIGDEVGYSVRGEHCGTIGVTRVMYITSYSLLLYLIGEAPGELPFDYIMLDEFHERSMDVQVSALLLRQLKREGRLKENFKLILSSATAEGEEWKKYFDGFRVGEYSEAEEVFPVDDVYAENVCEMCNLNFGPVITDGDVSPTESKVIFKRIFALLDTFASLIDDHRRSILIFLPGRGQIDQTKRYILERHVKTFAPIVWHREVELDSIKKSIETERKDKKIKVYLATDIAEVSLTLPDVVYVIDSCMNKRKKMSFHDSASMVFPPLKLSWESATNARQRRGRVGRVNKGMYFSTISEKEHQNLSTSSRREYTIDDIDSLILHSLFLCGTPLELLRQCCEPAREEVVEYGVRMLKQELYLVPTTNRNYLREIELNKSRRIFGAHRIEWQHFLGIHSNEEPLGVTLKGFITAHGQGSLETDTMIFFGCLLDQLDTSAFLASVAAAMLPFETPMEDNQELQRRHLSEVETSMRRCIRSAAVKGDSTVQNDLLASAYAVLEFMQEKEKRTLSDDYITEWCEKRKLIRNRVVDAVGIYEEVADRVREFLPITGKVRTQDLTEGAVLLNAISIAACSTRAVLVDRNKEDTKRGEYTSTGISIPFRCSKNDGTPSLCEWRKGNVCVPMAMFPAQDKYFGSVTAEVSQNLFYLTVLLFTSSVEFVVEGTRYLFWVTKVIDHRNTKVLSFSTDTELGESIILARQLMCVKLATVHASIRDEAMDFREAFLSLKTSGADFDDGFLEEGILDEIPKLVARLLHSAEEHKISRLFTCVLPPHRTTSSLVHYGDGIS